MRNINLNEQEIHENLLTSLGAYLAKSDATKKLIQLKKSMDDMSFGIRKVDKDNTSPLDKLNQLEKSISRPKNTPTTIRAEFDEIPLPRRITGKVHGDPKLGNASRWKRDSNLHTQFTPDPSLGTIKAINRKNHFPKPKK